MDNLLSAFYTEKKVDAVLSPYDGLSIGILSVGASARLITRYGADKVEAMLGGHIEAVKRSGHVVVWQCDPMHGCVLVFP